MNYQAYVINLEHAVDRWNHVESNLKERAIPYIRIEGVYGDRLEDPVNGYDERKYKIHNGKMTNKREIGCYFSHIKALKEFLKTEQPYAILLEDDVTLPENIITILDESIALGNHWDLLRLTSSRDGEYLVFAELSTGHKMSYNTRVLKNTGAYFINRDAAQRVIERMMPMYLPYDEALDRDWDGGFVSACVTPFPVALEEEMPSQIPRADRIHLFRATTFHLFHIITHVERMMHRKRYFRNLKRGSK